MRSRQLSAFPRCAECGGEATEVDHRVRIVDGGADDPANLQSLCHGCHAAKTARER